MHLPLEASPTVTIVAYGLLERRNLQRIKVEPLSSEKNAQEAKASTQVMVKKQMDV